MSIQNDAKEWSPVPFLSATDNAGHASQAVELKTALVVINTPIVRKDIFETVWKNSSLKYCADGGANRLHSAFGNDRECAQLRVLVTACITYVQGARFLPDLIKGDLDSLNPEVQAYYESRGVKIVADKDEYSTDLGKCIKSVMEVEAKAGDTYQLVIYGGLSGRLDQTIHTLHTLQTLRKQREWSWIVSEESLTCMLDAGKHILHMPRRLVGKTCGILPLGVDSAHVKTTGLEWNLPIEGTPRTSLDTMVSTSNHLVSDIVTLETDKPVFWTAELRQP